MSTTHDHEPFFSELPDESVQQAPIASSEIITPELPSSEAPASLEYLDSSTQTEEPDNIHQVETVSAPQHRSKRALALGAAGTVLVAGIGLAVAKSAAGGSHTHNAAPVTTEETTPTPTIANTTSAAPAPITTAAETPSYSPTTIPNIAPTQKGPSSGNVDLRGTLSTDRTDTVPLPDNKGEVVLPYLRDPNTATPAEFVNSFLANFAYYMSCSDEAVAKHVLSTITDDPGVISYMQSERQATQSMQTGGYELVEFWDSKTNPAEFASAVNQDGLNEIKLVGGQLNLTDISTSDPTHPGTKVEWQTGQNHDPLHTARIANLELAWHETPGDLTGKVKINWINLQLEKPN